MSVERPDARIVEAVNSAITWFNATQLSNWAVEAGETTESGLGGALEVAIDGHLMSVADTA